MKFLRLVSQWLVGRGRWILNGDGWSENRRNPFLVLGRLILSIWIAIIVACALIIGGIFIADPNEFGEPQRNNECITVDTPDGSGMDTCDLLVP